MATIQKHCKWYQHDPENELESFLWTTACGGEYPLTDLKYKFCPDCGGLIIPMRYERPDFEEE